MDKDKKDWHKTQVQAFKDERLNYVKYADTLEDVLEKACRLDAPMALVSSRAKTVESFAEKILRKYDKYKNPVKQITDLCGARVVTHTQAEADRLCEFVEKHFEIDEGNSLDTRSRLRTTEFGYRAVHYVVQMFRPSILGIETPVEIGPRKAEIQVCTMLQHAWAAVSHDRLYKSDIKVPETLERQLGAVAALFENADDAFSRLTGAVDIYIKEFDAYMKPERIRDEIDKWEAVMEYYDLPKPPKGETAPGEENVQRGYRDAAHKVAQFALALEDWSKAVKMLDPFRKSENSALLGDLGRAEVKCGKESKDAQMIETGRPDLKQAAKLDPANTNANCDLGDSWLDEDAGEALKAYEDAFRANPFDPRSLGSYLECKICTGKTVDFLPPLRGSLEAAIDECRNRANLGVYLPEAHYDMGKFLLFLDRPYDSLNAYAKAVHLSDSTLPIEEALASITKIIKCAADTDHIEGLEWIRQFLSLAVLGKSMLLHHNAAKKVLVKEDDFRKAVRRRDALAGKPLSRPEELDEATGAVTAAQARWDAAVQAAGEAKKKAASAQAAFALKPIDAAFGKPVVIVVGGCDVSVDERLKATYTDLLTAAFEDFEGTIISAGTTAGIGGIVGNLDRLKKGAAERVAYLPHPRNMPEEDEADTKHYEVRRTRRADGKRDYTPLGPIQTWVDLLTAGIKPWDVRLLGVNGGRISAAEYRLGLALGAVVGIIEASGRAASELLPDVDWWDVKNLLRLPHDPMTLRAFVNPGTSHLTEDQRKAAGKAIHGDYVESNQDNPKKVSPSMMPWPVLRGDFKRSNLEQAAYAEEILRRFGYGVEPVGEDEDIEQPAFPGHDIEAMAEMEHGRWNAERLLDGWRYGPKRDPEKKISPYIVPWEKLPPHIQQYDLAAVRNFPKVLAQARLKVVKMTDDPA